MRIAFVTPEYVTENNFHGGLANYLARVCLALKTLDQEPIIIVGTSVNEHIEDMGIPIYRVNTVFPGQNFLQNIPILRRLSPVLKWVWQSWRLNRKLSGIHAAEKIDLVQYSSYTATALFQNRKIPSVVRLSSIQNLIDQASNKIFSPVRSIMHILDIHSMKNTDSLFAPSILIAERAQNLLQKSVLVIESPFSLPTVPYDRKPCQDLLGGKEYLLFFGSIGILKGVKTIAGVISNVLQRYPNLYFVFAGKDMGINGGPMMQYLWECADSNRGRVLYPGILRQSQLFPVIEGAKAVVLPSIIDNLPNTCIEAMAFGRVVIGTREASFEQLIEDGVNGFLCTINDERSLLESIERALHLTENERQSISLKAQQRIERLKPDHVVRELLDFYGEVIGSHDEIPETRRQFP